MRQGEIDYANRKALQVFDEWLDVTGLVDRHSSYYYELSGIIEDAVKIGAMTALEISFEIMDGELIEP